MLRSSQSTQSPGSTCAMMTLPLNISGCAATISAVTPCLLERERERERERESETCHALLAALAEELAVQGLVVLVAATDYLSM